MRRLALLCCIVSAIGSYSVVSAGRQNVIDDGYSWFEAGNVEGLNANHQPESRGWYLISHARVFGEYPVRSAIKFVVSKAGKPVATTRCEVGRYSNTTGALDESYMQTEDCWRKDTATKELGVLDLSVYAVNGQTDEETLVRTYKIDVRSINRVRSGQEPGLAPPQYLIQRHNEAPVSWIFFRPREYVSYLAKGTRPERRGANHIEFYYNLSPDEKGKELPHGYMRCSVNGKRLVMPGPDGYADQAISHVERSFSLIYQDRIAPRYHRGTEYQDEIGFRTVRLAAPLTWGEPRNHDTNRLAVESYPGNWQCEWLVNGEVWRTWRFTIGANGRPPLHPEQNGNVNLGFNSYLIDMDIPAGGSPLDKRLNGPSTSLFYGVPWKSAEGKTLAGRVPKKGNPYPVASNLPDAAVQWWQK